MLDGEVDPKDIVAIVGNIEEKHLNYEACFYEL
jgi:hypothetical protein